MRNSWSIAGVEPRLDELLADPIVHLVMQRDGISPDDVRQAMRKVGRRDPVRHATDWTRMPIPSDD